MVVALLVRSHLGLAPVDSLHFPSSLNGLHRMPKLALPIMRIEKTK
jgi:hypothetical protein